MGVIAGLTDSQTNSSLRLIVNRDMPDSQNGLMSLVTRQAQTTSLRLVGKTALETWQVTCVAPSATKAGSGRALKA